MIPVVVWGAAGRMGRCLIRSIVKDSHFILYGAVDRPDHPSIGAEIHRLHEVPGIEMVLSDIPEEPDKAGVVIDFSLPGGTAGAAEWAARYRWALISGTTGLEPTDIQALSRAETSIPVLTASNFSIGIQLLSTLCALTARSLPPTFHCSILDVHHAGKKDRPSGTARTLARVIKKAAASQPEDIVSIRVGHVVGEHDVRFTSADEDIILSHRARSRDVFASGALTAAKWLFEKPPGRYSMADVLGIDRI